MEYIKITNLTKIIKRRMILKNINLELERGKIFGFFGRNGSGKTMLFRAMSGLILPTLGEISIFNEILHKDISFPKSIGVIIEYPGFLSQYTGFENLELLASIKNQISGDEIKQAITQVGLEPDDDRKVKQYSLGMKQRLGIAQAIMESPDIIILDEPTNSLDEKGVQTLKDILLKEKSRGATILIASHNKYDLDELSDQQFNIENGEIIS